MKLAGAAGGIPGADDFTSGGGPTHPILEWVANSGWQGRALVFVLACIAAPVIEETMFRGVLYRHLREATAGRRVGLSIAASALANSFLFAAIHPQGLFGLPVLMLLATTFSLAREWRGSLLAPMAAHAFNNGVMTLLLFQVL
jgi:membrane protease YdiL (CAAX protease family)